MYLETNRGKLIESINAQLKERGLKPIPKLGDSSEGEREIIALEEIRAGSERYFVDVRFRMRLPDGSIDSYAIRFNVNGAVSDGAVFVPVINGKFAVVKQWRVPLGRWTYELPRGFCESDNLFRVLSDSGAIRLSDLPLGVLERELGAALVEGAQLTSVTHLGDIAQNSSTDTATPSYFLVQVQVPEASLTQNLKNADGVGQVKIWDAATVRAELGKKLSDSHSITALALAFGHFERMAQMAR
jgi:hypothetical protein